MQPKACKALRVRWPGAVVLPMDGYHLPRRLLDAQGMRRRGAPHPFDPERLRADLLRLQTTGAGEFPAFDHAEGDPREAAIRIDARARPVFVEGLYLLLRDWRLEAFFDLRVFLDCPLDLAMRRVAARHLARAWGGPSGWSVRSNLSLPRLERGYRV